MRKNTKRRGRALPFFGLALLPAWGLALDGPTGGYAIDVQSREEVRNFYNGVYKASEGVDIGWTGDLASCNPGDTATAYKDAVIRRINYFRAMAGVPADVVLDYEASAKAQQAALMMAANNALNHFPPPTWSCYAPMGYEAAGKSNLSLGSSGPEAVANQMRDDGDNNTAVGHRRWLLYPGTRYMGTGDVKAAGQSANAVWIQDPGAFGSPRPPTRTDFVAWPPPGHVPRPLLFPRWSFSYPGADFSVARVSVRQNGVELPVRTEIPAGLIGENSLVWTPALNAAAPAAEDTAFSVEVRDVAIGGMLRTFGYEVVVIDPALRGPDTLLPLISGKAVLRSGETGLFRISPVPGATAYRWRRASLRPAAVEGAERGAPAMVAQISAGYRHITGKPKAKGRAAFHLANPALGAEILSFRQAFLVEKDARLQYMDLLGWASPDQHAKVQVSSDDGLTWETVDERTGRYPGSTSGPPPSRFVPRSVSLARFAGQVIRLRFVLAFEGGRFFQQTGSGYGWYLDEIRPVGLDTLADESLVDVPATPAGFGFTPTTAGEYLLQARALAYGPYPLEWGPPSQVVAVPPNAGTPRPFRFRTVAAARPGAVAYSNTLRPAGLTTPTAIEIEGGEYSINNGPYRTAPGLVRPGDRVRVRVVAAPAPGTASEARVSIGGVLGIFRVVTGS